MYSPICTAELKKMKLAGEKLVPGPPPSVPIYIGVVSGTGVVFDTVIYPNQSILINFRNFLFEGFKNFFKSN